MAGGAGNDVLVWNNGDGSDTMDGDGGADEIEVNGAVSQGDPFTFQPNPADGRAACASTASTSARSTSTSAPSASRSTASAATTR